MIFVTVGTHPDSFERLIAHIDNIAPLIKEKIIIQRGFTQYSPKNVEFFDFTEDMDQYYSKARIVISQSATSLIEFLIKYHKPVITVPRQKKYGEHINDHQVEFGDYLAKKRGVRMILNISDITPELLKRYNSIIPITKVGIHSIQKRIKKMINQPR